MNEIKKLVLSAGAVSFGAVKVSQFAGCMGNEKIQKINSLCPNASTVFCALFPYYTKGIGNLAVYARGRDYHLEITERLDAVCSKLRERFAQNIFVAGSDSSPLPEVQIAALSGAGTLGLNGLIFSPPYGSYVFIGTIMTDRQFDVQLKPQKECVKCGKCAHSCPTGALRVKDGKKIFFLEKCVSYISQKRGELSDDEKTAIRESPLIWGCDICAQVCPMNEDPAETPIEAFKNDLIYSITQEDLNGLSNRQFMRKYRGRAFVWHGIAPLRRNLELKQAVGQISGAAGAGSQMRAQ